MNLEFLKIALENKDVNFLCDKLFNVTVTKKQGDIVRAIAFPDVLRVVISCMTRYGKSFCVSMGVLIYILIVSHKSIILIAPKDEQAKIIRNYISEFIIEKEIFRSLVDIELTGLDRLKSEVSKKRITFKNGNSIRVMSAEGEAFRLMGFGGDMIIDDEDCLIEYDVYRSKISRMLGDSSDSKMVSIGNPWHRNNQMWKHWTDPKYLKIHVDYKTALKEGRVTQVHIDEQRELLTPIEFKVLYEADFPEESIDALFKFKDVMKATEAEPIKEGHVIISCDVADKGLNKTVIMFGYEKDGFYTVLDIYDEPLSDTMDLVDTIVEWYERKGGWVINIDVIGVGSGVVSGVKRKIGERVIVNACHFGEGVGTKGKITLPGRGERILERKPTSEVKRFSNRKAEQYFRLRNIFEEGMISIPKHRMLIDELMSMEWDINETNGKIIIIDPEGKSPDFADALVYFIWKGSKEVIIDFG